MSNRVFLKMNGERQIADISENNHPKIFNCASCSKSFKTKEKVKKHAKWVHVDKQFECSICAKLFKTNGDLQKHIRGHTKEKVKCDDCGRLVKNINSHKKTHEIRMFKCNICGVDYKTKAHLSTHIQTHDENEMKKPCPFCPKTFQNLRYLEIHKKSVHMNIVDRCEICSRQVKDMTRHLVRHSQPKSYIKCHLCMEMLKGKDSLKMHIQRRHTNAKDFKCELIHCSRTFSNKYDLNQHYKKHESADTYKCKLCERSFKSESGRRYHQL